MKRLRQRVSESGFTLAEILIVVSILALILILLLLNAKMQIIRGYDARRKSDLTKIRRAVEEYYNDHDCYPSNGQFSVCGGPQLQPALDKVPCDPTTGIPYLYWANDSCSGFVVCAILGDTQDPDIARMGCNGPQGCGWGGGYNYCLSSGMAVVPEGFIPPSPPPATPTPTSAAPLPTSTAGPTPTNTPTPTPAWPTGPYACSRGLEIGGIIIIPGVCNNFGDPEGAGCPTSFVDTQCLNKCGVDYTTWCP